MKTFKFIKTADVLTKIFSLTETFHLQFSLPCLTLVKRKHRIITVLKDHCEPIYKEKQILRRPDPKIKLAVVKAAVTQHFSMGPASLPPKGTVQSTASSVTCTAPNVS